MDFKYGHTYFISDEFFKKVNDPYLKINYENTSRPHYFAIQDTKTSLYWLAPLSSKIEKYEKIILKQERKNKPCHSIKIVKIRNQKVAAVPDKLTTNKEER